jgi:hypothetical protein
MVDLNNWHTSSFNGEARLLSEAHLLITGMIREDSYPDSLK